MSQFKPGTILIAHPEMLDPLFGRSVILLLSTSAQGTMGVNIAGAALQQVPGLHRGGPLRVQVPFLVYKLAEGSVSDNKIGDSGYAFCATAPGDGDEWVVSDEVDAATQSAGVRLLGYAGWGEGQLDMEVEMGGWLATDATIAELLAVPADQRYDLAAKTLKPFAG